MMARNHEGEVCKPWLAKGARLGSLECGFIKARPRGVAFSSGRSWCGFGKARACHVSKTRDVAHQNGSMCCFLVVVPCCGRPLVLGCAS
ncbi:hypothetical protein TIFTF001_038575 [Ficus carica]|uniref:Uncharacterized protein n=1 Tax=Ficus carica TaxID=3494 RepID=A0AA88JA24_FICCA|nr:hypothetical protein TIFTF001_038575 [Ficus carica]